MDQASTHLLLILSASQVVQVVNDNSKVLCGSKQNELLILREKLISGIKVGLSIVIDLEGKIEAIGYDDEIRPQYRFAIFEKYINATGLSIIPGLIDPHTHPIWAGDRIDEFAAKMRGQSYNSITLSGGGIYRTVEQTKASTDCELYSSLRDRLFHMMKCGTTTVECKSGYGLEFEQELRLLKLLATAKNNLPIDILVTYLPAHAVPKTTNEREFTEQIIKEHVRALKSLLTDISAEHGYNNLNSNGSMLCGSGSSRSSISDPNPKPELIINNVDVFCEKSGYFNPENTFNILSNCFRELYGPNINFHGDELSNAKSYQIVGKLRSKFPALRDKFMAISHLEELDCEEGIASLAKDGKTIAILLPITKLVLGIREWDKPPARKIIDSNIPVAIGTDFNPSSYCLSMPIAMYMAVTTMKMTPEEVLVGATLNAAASLNISKHYGSIEIGKFGDLVILDTRDWRNLIYQFGNTDHVILGVCKKGRILYVKNPIFPDGRPFNSHVHENKTGEMIYEETYSCNGFNSKMKHDEKLTQAEWNCNNLPLLDVFDRDSNLVNVA